MSLSKLLPLTLFIGALVAHAEHQAPPLLELPVISDIRDDGSLEYLKTKLTFQLPGARGKEFRQSGMGHHFVLLSAGEKERSPATPLQRLLTWEAIAMATQKFAEIEKDTLLCPPLETKDKPFLVLAQRHNISDAERQFLGRLIRASETFNHLSAEPIKLTIRTEFEGRKVQAALIGLLPKETNAQSFAKSLGDSLSWGRAQDTQSSLFTVGAFADAQYADTKPRGGRTPREAPQRLQAAVHSFNRHKVDFVVSLGDFIDWDDIHYSNQPDTTKAVDPVDWTHFETLDKIWQQIEAPRYHVLGNHEWCVPDQAADGKKPERVLHKFGFKDKAYHSFVREGFRFVILDGNDRYMYAYPKGSAEYLDAKTYFDSLPPGSRQRTIWNGAISGRQLIWLREQLSDAAQKKQRVVICCHYPIHEPAGAHTLLNHAEVRNVLDDFSHVVLWLNGHNHQGGYALVNEGSPNQRHHLNLKGMQNGDDRYYRLVFFPDRIQVFRAEEEKPEHVLLISVRQKVSP